MSLTKTAVNKLLVAERKSMRQKQKQSAFMRKTLNIYNGMVKRAKETPNADGIDFNIEEFRDAVSVALLNQCPCCQTPLRVSNFAIDHMKPIARGGSFSHWNIVAICQSCNWQKGKLTDDEFKKLLALLIDFEPEASADVKRRLSIGGKWSFKS